MLLSIYLSCLQRDDHASLTKVNFIVAVKDGDLHFKL
jgi:hypothetical protein